MSVNLSGLTEAVAAASGVTVAGTALLSPDQAVYAGWHVVELPDGSRLRIDYPPGTTPEQMAAGDAAAVAFDLRPRRPRSANALETDLLDWIAAGGDAATRQLRAARVASRALALALNVASKLGTGSIPVTPDELEG